MRSGGWPNVVLRLMFCKKSREERRKEMMWKSDARKRFDGARDGEMPRREEETEADKKTKLGFAVCAFRDLKANEEVVLG